MRESTGSTWIFSLVIIFIFLFSAFLTLTLSYSRTYKIKNEFLSILEKQDGYTANSREIINNYLSYNNYNQMGKCPDGYYGEDNLTNVGSNIALAQDNNKYYYCLRQFDFEDYKVTYDIILFSRFNLPFIGQITNFSITGNTVKIAKSNNIIINSSIK